MAAQGIALDTTKLQSHTIRPTHRGVALFLFLRFLPASNALSNLFEFALRDNQPNATSSKAGVTDSAGILLKAIELAGVDGSSNNAASALATINGLPWQSTLCFSFNGFKALGVDAATLQTFPEAYRQGMAARAHLLGDAGDSAPERWEGGLGDRNVHALLILSSPQLTAANTAVRAKLRAFAAEFNTALTADEQPSVLRGQINKIAAVEAGVEILHVELGEDPFKEKDGAVVDSPKRIEHFGYRDGISQPFVLTDVQTGAKPSAPPPGGGRPIADGTWAPLAPGELFLGLPDEDGLTAVEPANSILRNNGAYLVFRKLEQDVVGFHSFLAERRSNAHDRERLAAQMMGRWPNGLPIVKHPDHAPATPDDDDETINDFRFERDDPHGLKCPIGSHVRRVNPRDVLGGDAARRHRILRRGISYGGALIPPGSPGDGEPRGLLFVALNARIDLQFEFIQRDWLNTGESFGRVGAGKCPITGAQDGECTDAFQEGGRIAPDTHLPRFVTTRGGEYFFVPSLEALTKLRDGDHFAPDQAALMYPPAAGSVRTSPELFAKDRLMRYTAEIIGRPGAQPEPPPVKRLVVSLPSQTGQAERGVVFLARHADVAHAQTHSAVFTEKHYLDIGRPLTGDTVIIGLPDDDADRKARIDMLWEAYQGLAQGNIGQLHQDMAAFVAARSREALMRVGPAGRMDLLQDLGLYIPFLFMQRFFGVTGPNWLTPVAIATKYGRSNAAETPKQWLMQTAEIPPQAMPYLTMQTWTRFAFAEVFTNIIRRSDLSAMARQAALELQQHIDQLIARERAAPSGANTLLANLVKNWKGGPGEELQNARRARLIITDLLGALAVNTGSPFARVMELVLDQSMDLEQVLGPQSEMSSAALNLFIEESLRLNPAGAVQFRTVKADPNNASWCKLPSGGTVEEGDLVVLMVMGANRDWRVFGPPNSEETPDKFSLKRNRQNYLTFGGPKSSDAPHPGGPKDASGERTALHHCWGENIGLLLVREMLKAVSQLRLLRRAAGPAGETALVLNLPYSLAVRYSPANIV